jgi:hypothetical protein
MFDSTDMKCIVIGYLKKWNECNATELLKPRTRTRIISFDRALTSPRTHQPNGC